MAVRKRPAASGSARVRAVSVDADASESRLRQRKESLVTARAAKAAKREAAQASAAMISVSAPSGSLGAAAGQGGAAVAQTKPKGPGSLPPAFLQSLLKPESVRSPGVVTHPLAAFVKRLESACDGLKASILGKNAFACSKVAGVAAAVLGSNSVMTNANAGVTAKLSESSRWRVKPTVVRLASIALARERARQTELETAIVGQVDEEDLLLYVDFGRADETMMKTRDTAKEAGSTAAAGPAEGESQNASSSTAVVAQAPGFLSRFLAWQPKAGRHAGQIKILQSDAKYGMLIRRPGGQLISLIGRTPCPLQILKSTSGANLFQAAKQRDAVSSVVNRFRTKLRYQCMDGAPSNGVAERLFMAQPERKGWESMFVRCEVHLVQLNIKKTFHALVPNLLRGQLHFSLAINEGDGLRVLQQCVRDVVQERVLVLRDVSPPADILPFKRHVMALVLARGRNMVMKRLLMQCLPNGNWQRRDRIEIYVPPGPEVCIPSLAAVVAEAIVTIVAGARYTTYSANRWTKADEALDEIALMDIFCGVGSEAFRRFCAVCTADGRRARAAKAKSKAKAAARIESPAQQQHQQLVDGILAERGLVSNVSVANTGNATSNLTAEERHRETVNQHRRLALQHFESEPLGITLVTRQIFEPYRILIQNQLKLGSVPWEAAQQALEVRALRTLDGERAGEELRNYDLTVCASQMLEEEFLERTRMMLHSSVLWQELLPAQHRTLRMRTLAFRMLSSSQCLAAETLRWRHQKYPCKLFSILLSEEHAENVLRDDCTPCLRDSFSEDHIEMHKNDMDGGLRSPLAKAKLRLIARIGKSNMCEIEALHGYLRRKLVVKSCQTWALPVDQVSGTLPLGPGSSRYGFPELIFLSFRISLRLPPGLCPGVCPGMGPGNG